MNKSILFFLISLIAVDISAQYVYEKDYSIPVLKNGKQLEYPFLGGINAPHFNEIDLDQDGTLDLVITDRSGGRVSPFINNGTANQVDYTYAPQYISLFPEIGKWLITRDYNCDGKMDLFVAVSSSVNIYRNISQPDSDLEFVYVDKVRSEYNKFEFGIDGTNVVNTGGSDLPAIYDVDNDGDLDLLFFGSSVQLDYHKNLSIETTGSCGMILQRRSKCWGDFTESNLNGEIFLDSCRFGDMPNAELSRKGEVNQNTKGLKHVGSTTTAFDFDNNGSTDVLIGDAGDSTLTALFNDDSTGLATNSHIFKSDTAFPHYDTPIFLQTFPAAYFVDLNNDNKKDMLVSTNTNDFGSFNKKKDNILYYKNNGDSKNQFEFQSSENLFFDESIDLGKGNNPCFFDYNKDGLIDLVIGNHGNLNSTDNRLEANLSLFENTGTLSNPEFTLVDNNYLNLPSIPLNLKNNSPAENVVLTFGDIDNDGDKDLIMGDGIGNIHLFTDTTTGNNPAGFKLERAGFENINVGQNAAPFLYDINNDTILDLIIGTGAGFIEYYPNLGTKTAPIYTIEVESILWQNGDTIRLNLKNNPKISMLKIGQKLETKQATSTFNNGFHNIALINEAESYIDIINISRDSNTEDELITNAIINYSDKKWGNVDVNFLNYTRDAVPFIYEENGIQQLIVSNRGSQGIRRTSVLFYDSINNPNNNGNFHIFDTTYLDIQDGEHIKITGADINNDGQIDLAIGNDAGGFSLLIAQYHVGINDYSIKEKEEKNFFDLYPNPAKNNFQLSIKNKHIENPRLFLRDVSGKLILEQKLVNLNELINTSDLAPGIYFVTLISDAYYGSEKLIIRP